MCIIVLTVYLKYFTNLPSFTAIVYLHIWSSVILSDDGLYVCSKSILLFWHIVLLFLFLSEAKCSVQGWDEGLRALD